MYIIFEPTASYLSGALNLDFWLALLQRLGWNMSMRSGDQENYESLIIYYAHTFTHSVS